MYKLSIKNTKGMSIQGILDINASPAEYFTGCAGLAIDLLNGGAGVNEWFKSAGKKAIIQDGLGPASAIVMFLGEIHKHPEFEVSSVLTPGNSYYLAFMQIAEILKLKPTDSTSHQLFAAALTAFKIDGIQSITVTCAQAQEAKQSSAKKKQSGLFQSPSRYATEKQPYGPYADVYCYPP